MVGRCMRPAARKARRYADPRAFPSFKKEPSAWKFRKADRMIYHHQAPHDHLELLRMWEKRHSVHRGTVRQQGVGLR
jgi:hypothetical protein